MRYVTRALVAALLAVMVGAAPAAASLAPLSPSVSVIAPTAVAGLSPAKVVIVVGPVEGSTTSYRSIADSIYAEAVKWSSNVIRIYSPNATWAAVKPALQGASIVVYLGHGNGWPSPYPYDPRYTTKDGMGLNATAGAGNSNVKYYGEPSFANEIQFAPNAVVLLNHLCYASGNSEGGDPAPSLSVAMQRVDNFGQGFFKSGARAVIAEGHGSVNGIIRDLFSTHQSILALWRGQYDYNGNELSFQSMRSPTYTAFMDPDSPSGGYYRSLVGNAALRTEDVTGVAYQPTDTDPAALVVPGAAEIPPGGATLSSGSNLSGATGTLPEGTLVRVDQTSPSYGSAKLQNLSGSTLGWTAADPLVPRDSTPPAIWDESVGPDRLVSGRTPFSYSATLSETSSWTLAITGPGGTVASAGGSGTAASVSWDGMVAGSPGQNGTYTWTLNASDALANAMSPQTGTFLLWDGKGTRYQPLSPTRLLDTRIGTGLVGPFVSTLPRTFRVAGLAGIPADAVAVTGNLTIVGQTSAGWASLTPDPVSMPSTSTINFPVGDTRANGVTVPLSASGTLAAVYRGSSGSTANLIFDVTGYFLPSTSGATYVGLTPVRLLDTRVDNGLTGQFQSLQARTFTVGGRGGVPSNALAVTGNVTVTNQTSAGWVAVTPVANSTPSTSTLNFPARDNRANNFTIQLGSGGMLAAVFRGDPGATADLIIDVTGYFVAGNGGATYIPIDPARALDTRIDAGLTDAFTANLSRTFAVDSLVSVPSSTVAVTGNLTMVGPSMGGFASVTPAPDNNPPTSTINFPTGDVRANGVYMRVTSGALSAVYRAGTGATVEVIFDVTGYFVPAS